VFNRQNALTWITQFYLQITPCLLVVCKRSPPDGVAVAPAGPYTNHLHLAPDR